MSQGSVYDTPAGIQALYLRSLETLNQLQADRRAAFERGEKLHTYCVLGRFLFDDRANCMPLVDRVPAELFHTSKYAPERQCPRVMTGDELSIFMRGEPWTASSETPFPPHNAECDICKGTWQLESCHDFVYEWQDKRFSHEGCYRTRAAEAQRVYMREAFAKAGFHDPNLITIPNGYWPRDRNGKAPYYARPWYLVQVGEGPVFKLGWRKSVINIDWEETKVALPNLFEGEDVTRGDFGVHAWGYDKLAEYLRKLIPALGAGTC